MKDLTPEERRKIQDLTEMVAANWSRMKQHSEFVALAPTIKDNSGSANFSDTGKSESDSGLLPELAKEREEAAFNDIKRLTIRESVRATIKDFISSRNKVISDGKKRAKKNISRPFEFRQHGYKEN